MNTSNKIKDALNSIDYTQDELVCALVHLVNQYGTNGQLNLGSPLPSNVRLTIGYIDGEMIVSVLPSDTTIIGRDIL